MPERLEPVDDAGDLPEGDYVMTARVGIDKNGYLWRHDTQYMLRADWWTKGGATWQRVVRDPDLPTKPGAHILCLVVGVKNEQLARSVFTEGGRLVWVVTGEPVAVEPQDITCLHVYDEGRKEEGT